MSSSMVRQRRNLARLFKAAVAVVISAGVLAVQSAPVSALSGVVGSFDGVIAISGSGNGSILLQGWALTSDYPTVPLGVRITIDGVLWPMPSPGYITANTYRPDVGAVYPGYGNYHGFYNWFPAPHGTHTVCVQAQNSGVYFWLTSPCRVYSMPGLSPVVGSFDALSTNVQTQSMNVAGWATTADFPTVPIGVQVAIDGFTWWPTGSNYILANGVRTDVGAAYPGYGNNHGLSASGIPAVPGWHTVQLRGQNSGVYNNFGSGRVYFMAPSLSEQRANQQYIGLDISYTDWQWYPCTLPNVPSCDNPNTNVSNGKSAYPYMDWTTDSCSAVGAGPYDFRMPCMRHDFNWRNLTRLTVGFPNSAPARTFNNLWASNGQFRDDLSDRCFSISPLLLAPCLSLAGTYTAGVNAAAILELPGYAAQPYPAAFAF
jgi:hypothetical protein